MLRVVSLSLLTLWLNLNSEVYTLKETQLSAWVQQSAWIESLLQPRLNPDPTAEALVRAYLEQVRRIGFEPREQSFWVQSGQEVLASYGSTQPLPAASLTKIATTLVALETWRPDHTFLTEIGMVGERQGNTLVGDLVIQGGGDPFFVWEEAIALGNALNQLGLEQVTGDVIITGNFAMNYETDPLRSGDLLVQALDSTRWPYEAELQYGQLPPDTPRPRVTVAGRVRRLSETALPQPVEPLIQHESLPLDQILKAMNVYSNNVMSEMVADLLGGAEEVAQRAAAAAFVPEAEIQLINGSGLGVENRISARASTAMLMAVQRHLAAHDLTVADLLPVMGRDEGTLLDRQMPEFAAVKTGTLSEVSALAGAIPTRDRGLVWFTIINYGWALDEFRRQQDQFLQSLTAEWGEASPLPAEIRSRDRDQIARNNLGAPERNRLVQPTAPVTAAPSEVDPASAGESPESATRPTAPRPQSAADGLSFTNPLD
jgi:D-alanyl-D-alanine carboxypeptidase/D-alanyl-D-alanine-endopeptidase (penicillin-binding protein 4)